jgi:tRNA threonylcarbamoyladenosine biosynthesis protein TsaB
MKARNGIVYFGVYESDGEKLVCTVSDRVSSEEDFVSAVGECALITGDCCTEMKQKYFAERADVKCALPADRLQKASALCMAFEANPEYAVSADNLAAAYLQETKAEKDKAHR